MSFNTLANFKIGDLFDIFSGVSKPRDQFGYGNPLVTFKDIFNNFFLPETLSGQVDTSENDIRSYSIKKGDIFLTVTSETIHELGMSSVALIDYPKATFNGFAKRLRLKPNIKIDIDLHFIGYYFRSQFIRNQIFQHSSQTTRANLNTSAINSIEINLPNIRVQVEIGRILKALDDKIDNNLRTNQTLEEIARIFFKEWFINFNYPNSERTKLNSDLGEIPINWKVGKIGEISYVQNGFAFKSSDFRAKGDIGIIKIKNINNNVVDITKTDFVDSAVLERLDKKFQIEDKALLIAMTGADVGKVGLVPYSERTLWLNQRVGMFKEKIPNGNLYLYFLLTSDVYNTVIQNNALGSAQPNISVSSIESIRAIIPTNELVFKFGELIKPVFQKILDNISENAILKKTRDSLLPKLMSGNIAVNISNDN
jgi:type I restriction enzyme, S subunit